MATGQAPTAMLYGTSRCSRGEQAARVFADSPWNIPIEGFASGLHKNKHKDIEMGAGEMSAE